VWSRFDVAGKGKLVVCALILALGGMLAAVTSWGRLDAPHGDGAAHDGAALPALGVVGPFWLKDQEGRTFSEQSLDGEIWVAAFMFTRCPTVCPAMVGRMRSLQHLAAARQVPIELVSFSVDPENDTPEVLRAYMKEQSIDARNWRFLTGDSAVIRDTAERGFKIGVEGTPKAGAQHFGITHGTHLVLLDAKRTIRGYYQSSDPERLARLLDDAARLAAER
jgi:protein SCO1/2